METQPSHVGDTSLVLVGEEVNSYRARDWTSWVLQQEVGRGFVCGPKAFPTAFSQAVNR